MMTTITSYLSTDHKRCDDLFLAAETAVSLGKWPDACTYFPDFCAAIEHHFSMEEKVLFVAFERRTGSTAGPTSVMRGEHQQMRGLIESMEDALAAGDAAAYLGLSETLNIMMQQHNMKEENVLYPMVDNMLPEHTGEIIDTMRDLNTAPQPG